MISTSSPAFTASTAARPAAADPPSGKSFIKPCISRASVTTKPWKPICSLSNAVTTAGEMLATMGTDALIGAALGSEVPILGNVVGLVIGFAVGTIISFAAGKLGTAVGHAVWDAGGDAVHEADHIFHDLF